MTRTLGLLGGMAWPATAEAYRLLNQRVNAAVGGRAAADAVSGAAAARGAMAG